MVSVNNFCDARELLCLYVIKLVAVCEPQGPLAALQWARVGGWVTSGRSPPCNLTALLPISSQSSALNVRPLAQPQTAYLGLSTCNFPFIERGYCNPLQYQICIFPNDKPKHSDAIQFTCEVLVVASYNHEAGILERLVSSIGLTWYLTVILTFAVVVHYKI